MSRAVDRMVDILDCFTSDQPHLSLADVADQTQLDRATTLRFLNALTQRGVLRRDPASKRYTFGMRLIEWGAQAYGSADLTQSAEPLLRDIMEATNASAVLYVRAGHERVCLAVVESTHRVRHVVQLGHTLPLTLAAGGHIILAALPADEADAIIAADTALDDETRAMTREAVAAARERGYAVTPNIDQAPAWSLGCPVFDQHGKVIGSIIATGPDIPLAPHREEQVAAAVCAAARALSLTFRAPRDIWPWPNPAPAMTSTPIIEPTAAAHLT